MDVLFQWTELQNSWAILTSVFYPLRFLFPNSNIPSAKYFKLFCNTDPISEHFVTILQFSIYLTLMMVVFSCRDFETFLLNIWHCHCCLLSCQQGLFFYLPQQGEKAVTGILSDSYALIPPVSSLLLGCAAQFCSVLHMASYPTERTQTTEAPYVHCWFA